PLEELNGAIGLAGTEEGVAEEELGLIAHQRVALDGLGEERRRVAEVADAVGAKSGGEGGRPANGVADFAPLERAGDLADGLRARTGAEAGHPSRQQRQDLRRALDVQVVPRAQEGVDLASRGGEPAGVLVRHVPRGLPADAAHRAARRLYERPEVLGVGPLL